MSSSYPYLSRKMVDTPFHDPELLEAVWKSRWGTENPIGPIRLVLMHAPGRRYCSCMTRPARLNPAPFCFNISGEA